MSRRPQTRTTTFASGVTETRDAATGELIGYTGLGLDPFVEAPAPIPSLAELGETVAKARLGIETDADRYFVEQAERALEDAWKAREATSDARHHVANCAHIAQRAATKLAHQVTIHCYKCGADSRLSTNADGRAHADNIGWRGVRDSEHTGPRCPDCMRGATAFIEVASKSNPSKPHKVVVENYRATRCDCEGFKYRKKCDHMRQAAKIVGGGK